MSSSGSNNSSLPVHDMAGCFSSTAGTVILTFVVVASSLLLGPLCLFVLFLGAQRWMKRSSPSTSETTSNSDILTYNLAVVQLIGILPNIFVICNNYLTIQPHASLFIAFFSWFGEMHICILASLERYVAVVHPVRYLGLKRGVDRNRPIVIGCLWLIPIGGAGFMLLLMLNPTVGLLPSMPIIALFLAAMTFCSVSALRILIRPRPGKKDQTQVDQSKRTAVQIIAVIMGVLWLRFGWNVIAMMIMVSPSADVRCFATVSLLMFSLIGSLVLMLLFLQRARKLPIRDGNTGGEGGA